MITFSDRSNKALEGVHPDMQRVFRRAAAIADPSQDFMLLEGVRSRTQMAINYGKGRTAAECAAKGVDVKYALPNEKKVTWLNNPYASNHGVQSDGYGHAVDAAPYPLNWNDTQGFRSLALLIKHAAKLEGVDIVWGGDWKTDKDLPHYELVA